MNERQSFMGLERHVLTIAIVVVIGAIMSILDTTIVNIALESLSRDLHGSLSSVQWVATGYLLSLALVIPLTGWASERFGARRVWLTSVTLFVIGSMLCGFSWSLDSLIFFRVLQGIGGGMIMPVGMILMAQTAGPQRIGRVMSVIGVPMIMAPVLGPALGGLIVDNLSWRWIFFVNLPIGIIGLILGRRLLPRGGAKTDPGRLDFGGLALLSPGLALGVFGLSEVATKGGITATSAWLPMVVGVVLVAAFVRHALHAPNPLIDVRLFRDRALATAASTTFLTAAALFGTLLLLPLFFQVARGESALDAGLLQAPQGLGVALIMPWSGRLTDRVGGGRVAFFGLIALTIATIPLALMTSSTPLWLIDVILFVRGLGLGCSMMPSMAAAYAALDHSAVPRATSALNVLQRVGGSIGTAVLAVVLQHQITTRIPAASGGGLDAGSSLPPAARAHVAAPLNAAFGATFWWAVAMTAVAVIPAFMLMRVTRGVAEERAAAGVPATAAGD